MTEARQPWTAWQMVAAACLIAGFVALRSYNKDLASLAVTLPGFLIGIVGIARGRISLRGRRGPTRTYVGWRAIVASLPFLIIGGVLSYGAASRLWPALFLSPF